MSAGKFHIIEIDSASPVVNIPPALRLRPLTQTLARAGYVLNTRCGERGLCRGCEVQTASGVTLKACQTKSIEVNGLKLRVPEKSRLLSEISVVADFQPRCEFEIHPPLHCPSVDSLGLAIDIGTTTVVMALVRLSDGKILDRRSRINAQVQVGDDVVTRIEKCSTSPSALQHLQHLILHETLAPLWCEIAQRNAIAPAQVAGGVVAANTVMLHLMTGKDPSGMGAVPFQPRFLEAQRITAKELPLITDDFALPNHFEWLLLPGYSAFVGADVAAGWLSSGMVDRVGPTLLIDMGTNGEMILQVDGSVIGCATAAGPAFEGSMLSFGTRAITGSVSRLRGESLAPGKFEVEQVGRSVHAMPSGFCGSAYIDFLAIAGNCCLLNPRGRFDHQVAADLGITLVQTEFGWAWPLDANRPDSIHIREADVALLLQAKAAIAAGTQILLKQAGISPQEIECVYLAGGFGLNLGLCNAIACGLLTGFTTDQIAVIGNASLGGAYICLLDSVRLQELQRATSAIRIIELNTDPDFQDVYIDNLCLGPMAHG